MQTPEGRQKALETILRNNPDHFKQMGKANKGRKKTRPTGTQLLTPEERSLLGKQAAEKRWSKKDGEES